jgi:hypothetical protein
MLDAHEIEHAIAERVDPVLTACVRSEQAIATCDDVWSRVKLQGFIDHVRREAVAFRARIERRGPYLDDDALREMMQVEILPVTQMLMAVVAHIDHRLAKLEGLSAELRAMH